MMMSKRPHICSKENERFCKNIKVMQLALLIGIALSGFVYLCTRTVDPDTWFILNNGHYILENGFPIANPFTMHDDLPIIISQWATAVAEYLAYKAGSFKGLAIVMAALLITAAFCLNQLIWCLLGYDRKKCDAQERYNTLILLGAMFVLLIPFFTLRPSMISIIVVALELLLLEKFNRAGNWKYLIALPILSVVEVNFHTSLYPVVFLPMIAYLAHFILEIFRHPKQWKDSSFWVSYKKDLQLFAWGIASAISGIANPYGIKGCSFLFDSIGTATQGNVISELQVPALDSVTTLIFLSFAALVLVEKGTRLQENKKAPYNRFHFWLYIGGCLLYIMAIRNLWMWTLFTLPLATDLVKAYPNIVNGCKNRWSNWVKGNIPWTIGMLVIYLVVFGACTTNVSNLGTVADSSATPVSIADYFDRQGVDKENTAIFAGFNNGAYLEWRGYKTFIDARPELYPDAYKEYIDLLAGELDPAEFVTKYQFDYIVLSDVESGLNHYIPYLDGYQKIYSDEYATLYQRIP